MPDRKISMDSSQPEIELNQLSDSTIKIIRSLHIEKENGNHQDVVDLKDALRAIVLLQNQTKNYKRLSMFIFIIALLVLFCAFGAAMLAIKLSKDMKTKGDYITDMNGDVLRTGLDIQSIQMN